MVFVTVEGLGHVWAGGVSHLPESLVGQATAKLNATDVVSISFATSACPDAALVNVHDELTCPRKNAAKAELQRRFFGF